MSRQDNQQYRTRQQMEAPKEKKRKLPDFLKALTFVFLALPILFLAAYVTGAWSIQIEGGKMLSDGADYFVKSFILTTGCFGLLFLWFAFYWLEGD